MSAFPATIPVIVHDSRIAEQPPDPITQSGHSTWRRSRDGSILLHSDPVGVEPLAWRIIDRTLHLARYPAALAQLVPRASLDLQTLQLIGRIEYPGGTRSCFAGVQRVPAGTEIRIDSTGHPADLRRWWQLAAEPRVASPVDLWRALVAQCGELMERHGDSAVLLSGGLDSSAIAAAAAAAAREQNLALPLLLSVTYPGFSCDESNSQQLVARHLGLRLVQVNATTLDFWPAAQDSIQGQGIPTADLQAAATAQLIARAMGEGRNLVLMGLGGDALFAGDGAELELYRRGRLVAACRFFRDWGRAGGVPGRVIWYRRGLRRHFVGRPFGSREEINAAGTANRAGLQRALAHPAHGWRTEMIERTTRAAPTIGCPLYGKDFLEAFAGIQALDLAGGPGFKGLLRQVVTPHLPRPVVERQRKANFDDFHKAWTAREGQALIGRYRTLRPAVPESLELPREIDSLLAARNFSAGLIAAWFALCIAELYSSWNP